MALFDSRGIDHVGIRYRDLKRAVAWFREVLASGKKGTSGEGSTTDPLLQLMVVPALGHNRSTRASTGIGGTKALRRTFAIDILACSNCGGRLRLLATIHDSAVIEKILRHLDLPVYPPDPAPARSPAWLSQALPGFEDRIYPAGD